MENTPDKSKLPTLAELSYDIEKAFKNDQLNLLLNQPPPKTWIRQHPTATKEIEVNGQKLKVPLDYIPIERIEFLLTKIYQRKRTEIIHYGPLFNSVSCHVRLHVLNPVTGEWDYEDGVGAVGVQTNKGAAASDLTQIKQDAVMKALPAAKSYATKDAAENLGVLFGKDLNRKDTLAFSGAYDAMQVTVEMLKHELADKGELLTPDEKESAIRIIENQEKKSYSKLFILLQSK